MTSYDERYIKRPGSDTSYSDHEVRELLLCKKSLVYFAEKYIKVIDPIKGLIDWEPRPYQLRILKAYDESRFNIVMASRQVGKSTVSMIYLLWKAMFNDNMDIAVLANKFASAREVLKRIQDAYENLPMWLKPGVPTYNKMGLEFENGSIITAGSTTKDSIRGRSCSIVYLDEFAHVHGSVAREFWTSNYPTISTGGQLIIVSTPNGTGNLFYEIWKASESLQNDFVNIRVDWWEVPGRDIAWRDETIRNLKSIILFNQEYGNKFVGSALTLIEGKYLEKLVSKPPLSISDDATEHIWHQSDPTHRYVIGVDPAEGRGQDFHAINVFDITSIPWTQVARWRDNKLSLVDLPNKAYQLATKYNDAYVVVESNGIGMGVLNDLFNHVGYGNIARMQKKIMDLGIRANKGTKAEGAGILKKAVENGWVIINDDETINELLDFGPKQGSYKALNGNDDLVMSMIWALYFNTGSEFRTQATENFVEYFDFKKGEYVVDNVDAIDKSLMVSEATPMDLLRIIKTERSTDEEDMRRWLFS